MAEMTVAANGVEETVAPLLLPERVLRHKRLGTSLRLMEPATLRQRDLNRYMAAFREPKLGDSTPEYLHKVLYAGLKSGVVLEARVDDRPEPLQAKDVDDLSPARVRWFAQHVNELYVQVTTIPPE